MTHDIAGFEVPHWFVVVVALAYGLVIGSFLNVVIHRIPRGKSVFFPRSACPGCGRGIRWYENVPVLSWLLLRGRCAGCKSPISWRYPAVEVLTAAVVLVALERFGPTPGFLIAAAFLLLLLCLVFIDFELMLLPDALTLPGAFAGLALSFVSPFTTPGDALLGALLGLAVIESLNLAYVLVRGHDGMGAGDTKMMMMMGAFLGWQDVIVSLVLASFIGTLIAIPALVVARLLAPGPREGEAAPAEEAAPEQDAASAGDAAHEGPLAGLVPRTRGELLALLTVLALAASFLVAPMEPARALAGFLIGAALHAAASWMAPRATAVTEWLPLAGALGGAPPTRATVLLTLGVLAAIGVALALLGKRLPPTATGTAVALGDAADAGFADETAAPVSARQALLQARIPFGVFLGLGGAVTLLAGDDLIEWYLSLAARLVGGP